jgi:hypothetical protein
MQGLCRPVSVWPCAVVHATSSSSGSFGAVVLGLLAGLGAFKLQSSKFSESHWASHERQNLARPCAVVAEVVACSMHADTMHADVMVRALPYARALITPGWCVTQAQRVALRWMAGVGKVAQSYHKASAAAQNIDRDKTE